MVVFGYVKSYKYSNDSTLLVQVRIPAIHGPYKQRDAKGQTIRNYVRDEELPFYQSVLLPHLPGDGEVVALTSLSDSSTNKDFLVIGLTGATYQSSQINDSN